MTTEQSLKILFAGTADFSAAFLSSILNSKHQVIACVTQPDKVSGRGKKVQMTKVKEIAVQHNIDVYQFNSSLRNKENYEQLLKLDFDIMVVVAFGDILPLELIDFPKYKSINVHPSLLPFGRGASPVQNSIAKGDDHTAFCIIKMDETLDTGDILYRENVTIDANETSSSLFTKLEQLGGAILNKVLDNIEFYLENAQPQADFPADITNPKKTYTRKIKKSLGKFNSSLPAIELERKLRAYDTWPGLYFTNPLNTDTDIKITQAKAFASLEQLVATYPNLKLIDSLDPNNNQSSLNNLILGTVIAHTKKACYVLCADQSVLEISSVQLPGKKPTDFASIKNGYPTLLDLGVVLA